MAAQKINNLWVWSLVVAVDASVTCGCCCQKSIQLSGPRKWKNHFGSIDTKILKSISKNLHFFILFLWWFTASGIEPELEIFFSSSVLSLIWMNVQERQMSSMYMISWIYIPLDKCWFMMLLLLSYLFFFILKMDSEGRKVIVCDNGTGVSIRCVFIFKWNAFFSVH